MSSYPDSAAKTILEQRLEEFKDTQERDPLRAASARARFLREAAEYRQAVSAERRVRQSGWNFPIRKEKLAMYALVSLILAASLLLGGGASVAAAQNDLPDQPLYPLKLWTENVRLNLTGNPQEQAELLMAMEQTRVQEVAALTEKGITPPDQVCDRLETHLRQTLRLAAGMDDADLERTLLQLRDRLQEQDRLLQQLQIHASPEAEPLLTRTRQMLQLHLQLEEQGLADPQSFRHKMQNRPQYGPAETSTPEPNQQAEPGYHQTGPTAQPSNTPGASNGNGSCEGNTAPCEPHREREELQNRNGDPEPGHQEPGGHHPESPQGEQHEEGSGSGGSGCNGGCGSGEGGGHK
jgi:hypothetical protein